MCELELGHVYITTDGRTVRIICVDCGGPWPVIGLCDAGKCDTGKVEIPISYRKDGQSWNGPQYHIVREVTG